ncbi:DUF3843 family protein [Parabacteroides sp.]
MKNTKIFPKDWLQLHPYKQSNPTDLYYTRIANQIHEMMEYTGLASSFEKDDVLQISIRMAAYFEDVISGLNIWRTFITQYKEQTGSYLPFYTISDHYYDDEANLEDVRFLLWHFTQQYHGAKRGTFVNPDNPTNEETANKIYKLFCDQWTVAPENTKMQALFSPETSYDTPEKYAELLHWFHYNSYLLTDSNEYLTETVKEYWSQHPNQRENSQAVMVIYDSLAHVVRLPLLAYTSPKWLSLIMPQSHPDYAIFAEEATKAETFVDPEVKEKEESYKEIYRKFTAVADGKLLFYMKSKQEFIDFASQQLKLEESEYAPLADCIGFDKFAVYASPKEGLQLLADGVEYIKDEENPFYNEKKAADQALAFFIVKHCSMDLLKALEERGMLADAQTKSLLSPERGKAIIHDNWEFLAKYFIKET